MSKRKTIYNALPIVAAAYGEKFGVKIRIGGDVAETDGQTIVVPNVPESYPNMDVIWGYLAHEAAHVRFTDFSVPSNGGLHHYLVNAIEDARIELAMMKVYPGTVTTLQEVTRYMVQAGHYQPVTADDPPGRIVAVYSLYWLIANVLSQSVMEPFEQAAQRVLETVVPEGVVIRLVALLHKTVSLTSTEGAFDLATEILKMIEEEKEKETQQQRQQPSQDNSAQSQDDRGGSEPQQSSQGDDGGQDESDSSKSAQGDEVNKDSSGELAAAQQSVACEGQADDASQKDDGTAGEDNALQQVLSVDQNDLPDPKGALRQELQQVAQQYGDPQYATVKIAKDVANSPAYGPDALKKARSNSMRIRQQLYGLVQAHQRSSTVTQRRGKSLDHTRLSRVLSGDGRVFKKTSEKRAPNTAVHILVDMSSSMRSTESRGVPYFRIAQEAALVIGLALEGINGVNPAVTYFASSSSQPSYAVVKHGERVSKNAGRFNFMPTGSTPMAEGVWYSAYALSKTREERKLMIVITDGEPDNEASLKSVVNLCEQSDIEMIGIGIQTDAVKSLFSRSIVIKDVNDLKSTLYRLMEKSLAIAA